MEPEGIVMMVDGQVVPLNKLYEATHSQIAEPDWKKIADDLARVIWASLREPFLGGKADVLSLQSHQPLCNYELACASVLDKTNEAT